jgi:hypothetical protein
MSWLKAVVELKALSRSTTLATFQAPRFWLKAVALRKVEDRYLKQNQAAHCTACA